jgi:hypothetical protein
VSNEPGGLYMRLTNQQTDRKENAVIKLLDGMYDGLEEAPFKPIDGGYVFTSRNPWCFGPSHNYLVDETQKVAIASCIRETLREVRPVAVVAMFVLPVLMIAGAFLLLKFGCPTPIAIVVLTLFVFGPYLGMVHVYSMGRLRHLIANLPRTSERITLREANSNVAAHMSPKLLWLMLVCMSIGFLGSLAGLAGAYYDGNSLRQLPYLLPAIVLCGLVTVVLGKTAIGRATRIRAST